MPTVVVTPPATPFVTLAEAKVQCRVQDTTAHDDEVAINLAAAINHVEEYTGRALGEQTLRTYYDSFSTSLQVGRGPVISVESIGYYDADGIEAEVLASDYVVDAVSNPGWVVLGSDASWPDTITRPNAVWIEYVAGETDDAALKKAVLLVTEAMFDGKDTFPPAIEMLMRPKRPMMV